MKVSAISFSSKSNYNNIKTNTNRKENPNDYSYTPMSQLKSVPLVVLVAMSPLNASATNSINAIEAPSIEQVVQDKPISVLGKKEITTKNEEEFCRFIAYNTDENSKNAEIIGFNYNCYTKDGNIGVMSGVFQSVCPDKTDDNKFIVTYEEIKNSQNTGEIKTCYIPEEFGQYLLKFANSKFNNNAIDIASKSDLQKAFGEDILENTKDISNCVSTIKYPQD